MNLKTPRGTELPIKMLQGKAYLMVAHRLLWFREEHPDWAIETSVEIDFDKKRSLGRALIRNELGRLIATGHKLEDAAGFPDYIEKSETGAIGRALALCGYGTQFAIELEEGERIVDGPVTLPGVPALPKVAPDQPMPGDGFPPPVGTPYRIPFGKWARRGLAEIPVMELISYCEYLEQTAKKKGEALKGQVLEFLQKADAHIAWVNQQGGLNVQEEPGASG